MNAPKYVLFSADTRALINRTLAAIPEMHEVAIANYTKDIDRCMHHLEPAVTAGFISNGFPGLARFIKSGERAREEGNIAPLEAAITSLDILLHNDEVAKPKVRKKIRLEKNKKDIVKDLIFAARDDGKIAPALRETIWSCIDTLSELLFERGHWLHHSAATTLTHLAASTGSPNAPYASKLIDKLQDKYSATDLRMDDVGAGYRYKYFLASDKTKDLLREALPSCSLYKGKTDAVENLLSAIDRCCTKRDWCTDPVHHLISRRLHENAFTFIDHTDDFDAVRGKGEKRTAVIQRHLRNRIFYLDVFLHSNYMADPKTRSEVRSQLCDKDLVTELLGTVDKYNPLTPKLRKDIWDCLSTYVEILYQSGSVVKDEDKRTLMLYSTDHEHPDTDRASALHRKVSTLKSADSTPLCYAF